MTSDTQPAFGVVPEVRQEWDIWSQVLGAAVQPDLEHLSSAVPTLIGGMICTCDGLNLAATGIALRDVGKFATLSSSLFAVAGAHQRVVEPIGDPASTWVCVGGEDTQSVLYRFDVGPVGQLLLVAAARDVGMGVLMVATRSVGDQIRRRLEGDA